MSLKVKMQIRTMSSKCTCIYRPKIVRHSVTEIEPVTLTVKPRQDVHVDIIHVYLKKFLSHVFMKKIISLFIQFCSTALFFIPNIWLQLGFQVSWEFFLWGSCIVLNYLYKRNNSSFEVCILSLSARSITGTSI